MGNDDRDTPTWCVDEILPLLLSGGLNHNSNILEPCAGAGNIVKFLTDRGFKNITSFDIKDRRTWEFPLTIKDFIADEVGEKYDWIVTNPPYSLALEFAQKCLKVADNVCLLYLLQFAGTTKRKKFMQDNLPSIYVLSKRPSFDGKSYPNGVYGWFLFDGMGELRVI